MLCYNAVSVFRLIAVALAILRALSDCRYVIVYVVAVAKLAAVGQYFSAYVVRVCRIFYLRFVLARFVDFGNNLTVLVRFALFIEPARTVQTVVCKRLCDAAFIVVT